MTVSKKHKRVWLIAATASFGFGLLFAVSRTSAHGSQERRPLETREQRQEAEAVRRQAGIKAAAAVAGRFVATDVLADDMVAPDLDALIDHSDCVVRGTIVSNRSHVSDDGTWIVTDYRVRVTDALAGQQCKKGEVLDLRIPGGRVEFDGGTYADIKVSGLRRPLNDHEYLIFATKQTAIGDRDEMYHIAMGSQGLYELRPDGLTVAAGNKVLDMPRKYHQQPTSVLMNDLRDAIERENTRKRIKSSGATR